MLFTATRNIRIQKFTTWQITNKLCYSPRVSEQGTIETEQFRTFSNLSTNLNVNKSYGLMGKTRLVYELHDEDRAIGFVPDLFIQSFTEKEHINVIVLAKYISYFECQGPI